MTTGSIIDRLPPHSIEAEEAVLGSVLIDPEAIYRVSSFLKAEDFYIVKNEWVWSACLALHERREPIDFVTVTRELTTRNGFLENEAEQYTKKEPRDIKELSDKRLARIRGEIGDIMDTERNWKEWLLLNGKWIAFALLAISAAYFLAHGFGWL